MTEHIYDNYGKLLGTINRCGATAFLYDPYGKLLGQYSSGYTYDESGRLVGSGNLLTTLL